MGQVVQEGAEAEEDHLQNMLKERWSRGLLMKDLTGLAGVGIPVQAVWCVGLASGSWKRVGR